MKKQISFAFIILAAFFLTISYASENVENTEIASSSKEVDTIPKVTKAVKPNFSFNGRIGARGDDPWEGIDEGRVILRLVVTKDGGVRDPEVVEATPPKIFNEYALKTIMEYRFKPAMKNGKPVDFIVKLPMEFKIPQKNSSYAAYKARVSGRRYFKAGEYNKAIKAFTEAIKIDRKYSDYYLDRGKTYIELGEYNKAVLDMSKAIKLAPDEGSYYVVRSNAYMNLKDKKNMCLDLKKACDLGDCNRYDQEKEAGSCNG